MAESKTGSNFSGAVSGVMQVANSAIDLKNLKAYEKGVKQDFKFARSNETIDYSKLVGNQNMNIGISGVSSSSFVDIMAESEANYLLNMDSINRQEQQFLREMKDRKKAAKINAVTGAVSAGMSVAAMFSDERLKEDLELVDITKNGLGIYVGKYKEDTNLGEEKQLFMLAQEVENVYPDCIEETDGVKKVNYKEVIEREDYQW